MQMIIDAGRPTASPLDFGWEQTQIDVLKKECHPNLLNFWNCLLRTRWGICGLVFAPFFFGILIALLLMPLVPHWGFWDAMSASLIFAIVLFFGFCGVALGFGNVLWYEHATVVDDIALHYPGIVELMRDQVREARQRFPYAPLQFHFMVPSNATSDGRLSTALSPTNGGLAWLTVKADDGVMILAVWLKDKVLVSKDIKFILGNEFEILP